MNENVTRRRLLQLLVACLGLTGWSSFAWTEKPDYPAKDPVARRLTGLLAHPESAAAVGREYLQIAPEEAAADRLIDLIFSPDTRSVQFLLKSDPQALAKWLQAKQRDDFDRNRVVLIQRWMLSRTEARLCALVALT